MDDKIAQLEKELGEVAYSTKNAHKRIDELQLVTKAFYDLASDVKVMVNEMKNMKKDITDIKAEINEYHQVAPNKLIFNVKNALVVGTFTALLTALIALILK